MTSHTYNFGGALPPFLESWGGSSPSSSPLPPPLHCHGLLNLQVLITVKRYTKLHHYTELMSICLAMCILMARLCVYSHEGTFLYSVTFRYKKVPIIRFVVSKSLYSSCLSSHHSQNCWLTAKCFNLPKRITCSYVQYDHLTIFPVGLARHIWHDLRLKTRTY